MKVLVLGAAGKTGRLVIDHALAAGHSVAALSHSPEKDDSHQDHPKHLFPPQVDVFHGDAQNPTSLRQAMEGCQAVIDTIGGKTPFLNTDLESSTVRVVLNVMHELGVQRLIVISVLGAGDSEDQAGFFYRHLMMPTFLHGAMKDKNAMEAEIAASDIPWVIVRPPILSDADPKGEIIIVPAGHVAEKITRGDLARFLVDQLTSDTYLNQAVTIANP
jgi:uncharacterized protein YbjT (DUF2867 family)